MITGKCHTKLQNKDIINRKKESQIIINLSMLNNLIVLMSK